MSSCFLINNLHVTEAAVSLPLRSQRTQKDGFHFFFNRRLLKRKIWLHIKNKENKCLFAMQTTWRISRFVGKSWVQKSRLFFETIMIRSRSKTRMKLSARQNLVSEKMISKISRSKNDLHRLANSRNIKMLPSNRMRRNGGITYWSCRMNEWSFI